MPQIDPSDGNVHTNINLVIDGYAFYQIIDSDKSSTVLAEVVATLNTDTSYGSGMIGGTEYWRITNGALKTSDYSSLFVKRVRSGTWLAAGTPPFIAASASFATPVAATWGGSATALCHKASSADYGFAVDIVFQAGRWQGTMNFYRSTDDAVFNTIANGASEVFHFLEHSYPQSCMISLP